MKSLEKILDETACELMDDFAKFYVKQKDLHRDLTKSEIFEPWAIERISNLQVCLTMLMERVAHIEKSLKDLYSH